MIRRRRETEREGDKETERYKEMMRWRENQREKKTDVPGLSTLSSAPSEVSEQQFH